MSCELEPSGRRGPDRYNYLFPGSLMPQVVAGDMKPPFPQSMPRGPDCLQPEDNHKAKCQVCKHLIVSTRDLFRPGPLLFQFERLGPCKNCPLNPADPRGCKVRVSLADPLRPSRIGTGSPARDREQGIPAIPTDLSGSPPESNA